MGTDARLTPQAAARFVLGLQPGCSAKDVNRAYKRLALIWHPDKNLGQDVEEAKRKFQAIARARDCLLKSGLAQSVSSTSTTSTSPSRSGAARAANAQTSSAWSRRPGCTQRPTPAAAPAPAPKFFAAWVCGACEMRDIGAATCSSGPCCRATSSTLCFCGHPLSAHEATQGGKLRCGAIGCLCCNFQYVPPGAVCTCGHSSTEHDAVPHHGCEVPGCSCSTFHFAGTCACGHSWVCHRTEIRKQEFPEGRKSGQNSSADAAEASDSSSSCSSPEPPLRPPRRRPASANAAGRATTPNRPPIPPAAAPGRPGGSGGGADGRPRLQRPSSAQARAGGITPASSSASFAPAPPTPPAPPAKATGSLAESTRNAKAAQARATSSASDSSVATAAASSASRPERRARPRSAPPARKSASAVLAASISANSATLPGKVHPHRRRPSSASTARSSVSPESATADPPPQPHLCARPPRARQAHAPVKSVVKVKAEQLSMLVERHRQQVEAERQRERSRSTEKAPQPWSAAPVGVDASRPCHEPSVSSAPSSSPSRGDDASALPRPQGVAASFAPGSSTATAPPTTPTATPRACADPGISTSSSTPLASACTNTNETVPGSDGSAAALASDAPATSLDISAPMTSQWFTPADATTAVSTPPTASRTTLAEGSPKPTHNSSRPASAASAGIRQAGAIRPRRPTSGGPQRSYSRGPARSASQKPASGETGADGDLPGDTPQQGVSKAEKPCEDASGRAAPPRPKRSASRQRRPPSAPRGETAADVKTAAEAAAAASAVGRPWWERLHTCGKVRPSMTLPVGRRFCPPSFPQAPARQAGPRPAPATGGSSTMSWAERAAANALGEPSLGSSRAPTQAVPKASRNPSGAAPQRTSSLREDSFIFDDDDSGHPYFGVDSDEDDALLKSFAGDAAEKSEASRQPSRRRPLSAPCTRSTAAPANNEWWLAGSSTTDVIGGVVSNEGWWARDTLRRLHLEQLERLRAAGLDVSAILADQANPAAMTAAAATLAKRRGSV
jgi:hypothetical protein